jgi:hypothetical protein
MRTLLMAFLLLLATGAHAQSGPWAKYDAKMKGDSLLREASGGNLAEVQSLVQGGADVNWTQPDGQTALMSAAQGGRADVVAYLLEQGADPSLRWRFMDMTALKLAQTGGFGDIVAMLKHALQGQTVATPRPATGPAPAPVHLPVRRPEPAPSRGAMPAPAPAPVGAAATVAGVSRGGWPPFGTYAVGDRVQWRQSNGWFTGTVSEVGVPGPTAGRAEVYERKYRIADDRWSGAGEWWDWGAVSRLEREPFWTGFFVGEWALGEVMAVNDRIEGSEVHTEFAFHTASEALRVAADGSYRWKPLGAPEIRGRWVPAADGPGIVLKAGVQGVDWTLRNESNATEENIRGLQTARLTAEGRMSTAAKRPKG